MNRAVFLDRDGTLIREAQYLSRLEDLELLPGVPQALGRLGAAGFLRIVATNQSGVARGTFPLEFVTACHVELRRQVREAGGDIDDFYVCPHHPDHTGACDCRKPATGLLAEAARKWRVDLAKCWVVGDKPADILLGHNAGCSTALVRTGYGARTELDLAADGVVPDVVGDDLPAVVEEILRP